MRLLTPPPPPAGAPGRGRCRESRLRRRRSKRDWAGLPLEAILLVLRRLGDADLMFGGAAQACRSWRAATREPQLWRRVDTRGLSRLFWSADRMAWLAVSLAAGEFESFGEGHFDDDLLLFLAQHAPSLKSLHLIECYDVHTDPFAEAILRFPLLEELELSQCGSIRATWVVDLVATACPRLKHFSYAKGRVSPLHFGRTPFPADNTEAFAIARMHELRSLQLFRNFLDSKGLAAILDNCPHLECLDIRCCYIVFMDSSDLRAKCARITTKKLYPYVWTDGWEHFHSSSHNDFYREIDDERYAESADDSGRSFYLSGVEEADLEEHDRILGKGARRYLRI